MTIEELQAEVDHLRRVVKAADNLAKRINPNDVALEVVWARDDYFTERYPMTDDGGPPPVPPAEGKP